MTKACAKVFLIVFGNLLIFAVPLTVLFFPGLHTFPVLFMLAAFAAHVVGSVLSCRRFKCRFGVTPGRYVLCGALPAFAVNLAFAVFAIIFLCSAEGMGDSVYIPFVISIFCGGYSVCYLIFLTAAASKYE